MYSSTSACDSDNSVHLITRNIVIIRISVQLPTPLVWFSLDCIVLRFWIWLRLWLQPVEITVISVVWCCWVDRYSRWSRYIFSLTAMMECVVPEIIHTSLTPLEIPIKLYTLLKIFGSYKTLPPLLGNFNLFCGGSMDILWTYTMLRKMKSSLQSFKLFQVRALH